MQKTPLKTSLLMRMQSSSPNPCGAEAAVEAEDEERRLDLGLRGGVDEHVGGHEGGHEGADAATAEETIQVTFLMKYSFRKEEGEGEDPEDGREEGRGEGRGEGRELEQVHEKEELLQQEQIPSKLS